VINISRLTKLLCLQGTTQPNRCENAFESQPTNFLANQHDLHWGHRQRGINECISS